MGRLRHGDAQTSIDERRDVIEEPITRELDVSGWDLRKALRLMRKSNPPLLEWLARPIVYAEHAELAGRSGAATLADAFFRRAIETVSQ